MERRAPAANACHPPPEPPMPPVVYMMPKRTRPFWDPRLEPLGLEDEPGIEVPLLGYVSAGRPVETPEEQETIRVPSHMTRKASYALRVRGHSMIDDQIQDGDIIVIEQRQTAENGETVVALINGQQVTLKKFYVEAGGSASSRPIPRWRRCTSGMRRSRSWGLFLGWCG